MSQGNGSDLVATIRALEAQATDFELRATELRSVANGLRSLLGSADAGALGAPKENGADTPPRVSGGGSPATSDKKVLAETARTVLIEAGEPLHHKELSDRLQGRGIALPDDAEKRRLMFVHIAGKYPTLLRAAGNGRYAAAPQGAAAPQSGIKRSPTPPVNLSRVMALQANSAGGRGVTLNMVVAFLKENSGLPSHEVAKQLAPHVTSGARDPRKLIHSTLHYLIKQGRVRKADDSRLYLVNQTTNGQEPRLALDR